MKVELSDGVSVELKDSLNWGDIQAVGTAAAKAMKDDGYDYDLYLEAKYVTVERAIIKITVGEEQKEISFSRDWMNKLDRNDGDKLLMAAEDAAKKK